MHNGSSVSKQQAEAAAPAAGPARRPNGPDVWHVVRGVLLYSSAVLGTVLLLFVCAVGGAGYYTSRPKFCVSCHIMKPYYESWKESTHADVSCIECHFAPGFGGKARGKLLGLVQLAKYVTASEGPRPAAEIPDASCLRRGCHERRILAGKVDFHGIPFDHQPHMRELRRGKRLRCTSCHSQIVQGAHMTVTPTTCFLCHFKDLPFNTGLGACTRCHQIPDQEFDLGGGIKYSHELAYEKGVDCINCHRNVIRGEGEVPPERCSNCHNRPGDLARIDEHTFIHKMHVTDHRVDCLECHLHIEHSLPQQNAELSASNCAGCHPDHHRPQLQMLAGSGAQTVPAHSSGMLSLGVSCPTCHKSKTRSTSGAVLWKASLDACAGCHDQPAVERFGVYHKQLMDCVAALEQSFERAADALKSSPPADADAEQIEQQLDEIQHDLLFVRTANNIHNMHYAAEVLRAVLKRLDQICRQLKVAGPKVQLPEIGPQPMD